MQNEITTEPKQISFFTRIAWGCGGWADNWMFNVINYLFLFVYVDFFRMDPVTAGAALCVPRFLDAITDLYIGNFSDNLRSRWGRRRPLIIAGTIGCAILLPLFFTPPFQNTMQNPWYSNGPFWFLSAIGCLYYGICYTLFVVPYTALGYELGGNYDERTKVLAWRMYLGLAGQMIVPWVYKLSVNRSLFANIQQGAIAVAFFASIAILILGCIPGIFCKENPAHQNHPQTHFFTAVKESFSSIPFLFILGSFVIVTAFFAAAGSLGSFVSLYVVCQGNNQLNSKIVGYMGTLLSVTSVVSLLITTWVSRILDKKWAYIGGLGIVALSQLSYCITLTPEHPYWQIYSVLLFGIAMQGCWLMLDSMLSDVCDIEEVRVGHRSEGMFSSVRGFIQKLSQGLMAIVSGIILKFSGFDATIAQTEGLSADVLFHMKFLAISIPFLGCILGIVAFYFYPITRAKAEEAHKILEQRKAEQLQ